MGPRGVPLSLAFWGYPTAQEEGSGHACHPAALGRAPESGTLPIALSSLTGHRDF